jgi:hypothetical protein
MCMQNMPTNLIITIQIEIPFCEKYHHAIVFIIVKIWSCAIIGATSSIAKPPTYQHKETTI